MDDRPADPDTPPPSDGPPAHALPAPPLVPAVILNPYDAPAAPPGSTLGFDIPCLHCRYNLRGLPIPGRCPECGLETPRSLDLSLLRFRTPKHLARLRRGAGDVAGVLIALFFSPCLLAWRGSAIGLPHPGDAAIAVIFTSLGVGAFWLWAWGWWLLTEAPIDPGTQHGEAGRARALTRWSAVGVSLAGCAAVLSAVIMRLLADIAPAGWVDPAATRLGTLIVACLALGILAIQYFASMLLVRGLCAQLPDQRLQTLCTALTVVASIAIVLALFTWALPRMPDPADLLPAAMRTLASLLGIAIFPGYVLLLCQLGTKLKKARRDALAMWRDDAAARGDALPQPGAPSGRT